MTEPKWKRFEKLAYEIQKSLAQDAEVTYDDSIIGADSQVARQIDISIRRRVGQYSMLIVIDCKDYKEPVDIKDMEMWAGMVKDVRANKGAMIAASGFTPAALQIAKHHGIDTYRLIDTDSIDWKVYASVPIFMTRKRFGGVSFRFQNFKSLPTAVMNDTHTLEVFSQDGVSLGTLKKIIAAKWHSEEIDEEPGEKELLIGENLYFEFEGEKFFTEIWAHILVGREYYLGNVPVHLKGFQDLQSGGVITNQITTHNIEPYKIEQGLIDGWKKLDDPAELSIQPFMKMWYADSLNVDDQELS